MSRVGIVGAAIVTLSVLIGGCSGASAGVGDGDPTTSSGASTESRAGTADAMYLGSYAGWDSGSVVLEVDATGSAHFVAESTFWKTKYEGTGEVSATGALVGSGGGGGIHVVVSSGGSKSSGSVGGITLTVNGSVDGTSATGTWTSSNGGRGTWTARQ